jgi:hypothetical protein
MTNIRTLQLGEKISESCLNDVYISGESNELITKIAKPQYDARAAANVSHPSEVWMMFTGNDGQVEVDPNKVLDAEITLLDGIRHPGFVELDSYGWLEIDGVPRRYLTTKRASGQSLRQLHTTYRTPAPHIILAAADILRSMRDTGWLEFHGDIKPDNIVVGQTGVVVLVDPASGWSTANPSRGTLTTSAYNPFLDNSDVVALGVCLVETLTGIQLSVDSSRGPIDVAARPMSDALREHLSVSVAWKQRRFIGGIRLPREIDPSISPAMEAVFLATLGLRLNNGELDFLQNQFDPLAQFCDGLRLCLDAPPAVAYSKRGFEDKYLYAAHFWSRTGTMHYSICRDNFYAMLAYCWGPSRRRQQHEKSGLIMEFAKAIGTYIHTKVGYQSILDNKDSCGRCSSFLRWENLSFCCECSGSFCGNCKRSDFCPCGGELVG